MKNSPFSSKLMNYALMALATVSVSLGSAEAQLRAKIGNATVVIKPIACELNMQVLDNPSESEYAVVSRSCHASGQVTRAGAGAEVAGKVLVRSKGLAAYLAPLTAPDGTKYFASVSGVPPVKFYMSFSRIGPGEISVDATTPVKSISKNAFIAYKKALNFPADLDHGTKWAIAIGRIMGGAPYPPAKKAGAIEVIVE